MARRAGVVPFSLSSGGLDSSGGMPYPAHRVSPSRGHAHTQSHGGMSRELGLPPTRYGRASPHHHQQQQHHHHPPPPPPPPHHLHMVGGVSGGGGRALAARRESLPRTLPDPMEGYPPHMVPPPHQHHHPHHQGMPPALGHLAPIHQVPPPPPTTMAPQAAGGGGGPMLPGVAELTTGVSPYSTPAYSASLPPPRGGASPQLHPHALHPSTGGYPSPSPHPLQQHHAPTPPPPPPASYPALDSSSAHGSKRRASPDLPREASRRRHHGAADPRVVAAPEMEGPSSSPGSRR